MEEGDGEEEKRGGGGGGNIHLFKSPKSIEKIFGWNSS